VPKDCVRPLGGSWPLGWWIIPSEHGTVIFRGTDPEKVAEIVTLSMGSSWKGGRWATQRAAWFGGEEETKGKIKA